MISEEQKQKIKSLRLQGLSMMKIGTELRLSLATIQLYCKKFDPENKNSLTKKINENIKNEIIKYYLTCLNLNKTSKYFPQFSKITIRTHLKNSGLYIDRKQIIDKPKTNSKRVINWKKDKKLKLIEYKGGTCIRCGYKNCYKALEFHHLDPNKKDFSISSNSFSFEKMKIESDKCVLLCANCHREYHDGLFHL